MTRGSQHRGEAVGEGLRAALLRIRGVNERDAAAKADDTATVASREQGAREGAINA